VLYPEVRRGEVDTLLILRYLFSLFRVVVIAIKTEEVRTINLKTPLDLGEVRN
jgi:hypothetical protein